VGIDKGHGRVERWWWINTSLDLYGRKMTGVGELYLESGELVTFVYSHAKNTPGYIEKNNRDVQHVLYSILLYAVHASTRCESHEIIMF
jgi:hypothetical protein